MVSTRRRGIALIWVAVTLFALLAMVGLAMDFSIAVYGKQQLQNAADAAALAGAAWVRSDPGQSRLAAQKTSAANTVYSTAVSLDLNEGNADAQGDIVLGYYDRDTAVFTPDEVAPNAVQVMARRTAESNDGPIDLVFGPMVDKDNVEVWAEAIAIAHGGTGAGLIVLDPGTECSADLRGTTLLNVTDITTDPPDLGAIQINSGDCGRNGAICTTSAEVQIEAGAVNVVGCADLGGSIDPDKVHTDEDPIEDPLKDLLAINPSGMPVVPVPNQGDATIAPGHHIGEVKRTGDTLTLEPGIHVFDSGIVDKKSAALEVTGGNVLGDGVLLYILRGSLTLVGNGIVQLSPLDAPVGSPDSVYNGVTIFQHDGRDGTEPNTSEAKITGGNGLDLTGTLYFPFNLVEISGSGDGFGNQLISWQLRVVGTGEIGIKYDGRNPAPGNKVFLVR